MAAERTKLRRFLRRPIARPRRALIWTQLRGSAAAKPRNHFPGLTSQPIHDPSAFSWTAAVVANFQTIRQELSRFSAGSNLDAHPQKLTDRGGWNILYFYAGGRQVEATKRACPRAAEIIDSIPGAGQAGQAYLSVLRPGTHIKRHFGPTSTRLRCHFGLAVPPGARIRIGDEMRQWREGECLIFDDSFDHEVWNDSDSERVVLIIDFWHPELNAAERWAINAARRLGFGLRDVLHA